MSKKDDFGDAVREVFDVDDTELKKEWRWSVDAAESVFTEADGTRAIVFLMANIVDETLQFMQFLAQKDGEDDDISIKPFLGAIKLGQAINEHFKPQRDERNKEIIADMKRGKVDLEKMAKSSDESDTVH